jgi:hypothetical protein
MKRMIEVVILAFAVSSILLALSVKADAQERERVSQVEKARMVPLRPVHTFSIVARDPVTGELGVAVQSHWFNVGATVPWAEAGVGAIATQSFVDPSYGKLGLDLMRAGKSAPDALKALLAGDSGRARRRAHGRERHPRRRSHHGPKLFRPGQSHAQRKNLARDGPGF